MIFKEEVTTLSNISVGLLQKLEPEPVYVREYIEKECEKIQKEGWFEQEGDRPWVKTFEREKYILKIAFIHARKGEHITGADLFFELKDKKIIFVQSKRADLNGKIHFNRFQLQKLIELERQICSLFPFCSDINILHRYNYPPFGLVSPFLPSYYLPFRVTFYHLIMNDQSQIEERFFHTSEVSFTLAGRKNVPEKEFLNHGLKPDEFQGMFWDCKIGGPDVREDIKRDVLFFYSLLTNRFIIWFDIEGK